MKNSAEGQLEVDLSAKMREHYPDTEESIDDWLPKPFFDEFVITAYIDSDHVHNKLTRRSITGLELCRLHTCVVPIKETGCCEDLHLWGGISFNENCCRGGYGSDVYASKSGVKVNRPTRILGDK
eukprot:7138332-Ditylum_brightwellii.AAC.1